MAEPPTRSRFALSYPWATRLGNGLRWWKSRIISPVSQVSSHLRPGWWKPHQPFSLLLANRQTGESQSRA